MYLCLLCGVNPCTRRRRIDKLYQKAQDFLTKWVPRDCSCQICKRVMSCNTSIRYICQKDYRLLERYHQTMMKAAEVKQELINTIFKAHGSQNRQTDDASSPSSAVLQPSSSASDNTSCTIPVTATLTVPCILGKPSNLSDLSKIVFSLPKNKIIHKQQNNKLFLKTKDPLEAQINTVQAKIKDFEGQKNKKCTEKSTSRKQDSSPYCGKKQRVDDQPDKLSVLSSSSKHSEKRPQDKSTSEFGSDELGKLLSPLTTTSSGHTVQSLHYRSHSPEFGSNQPEESSVLLESLEHAVQCSSMPRAPGHGLDKYVDRYHKVRADRKLRRKLKKDLKVFQKKHSGKQLEEDRRQEETASEEFRQYGSPSESPRLVNLEVKRKDLVRTLYHFQKTGHLCDVTVVANGGNTFPAHAGVLAAASTILEQELMACPRGNYILEIPLRSSEVALLIKCLYTGYCSPKTELLTIAKLKPFLNNVDNYHSHFERIISKLQIYSEKGLFCNMAWHTTMEDMQPTHSFVMAARLDLSKHIRNGSFVSVTSPHTLHPVSHLLQEYII